MITAAPCSKNPMTYEDAILYCTFCDYGGHSNWRMPTRNEWDRSNDIHGWYVERPRPDKWVEKLYVVPVRDVR